MLDMGRPAVAGQGRGDHVGRDQGTGGHQSADLLGHQGQVGEAATRHRATAVLLGHQHRDPAELGPAPPPGPLEAVGLLLGDPSHHVQRTGVLQELAGGLLKQLLVVGESELHGQRPSLCVDVQSPPGADSLAAPLTRSLPPRAVSRPATGRPGTGAGRRGRPSPTVPSPRRCCCPCRPLTLGPHQSMTGRAIQRICFPAEEYRALHPRGATSWASWRPEGPLSGRCGSPACAFRRTPPFLRPSRPRPPPWPGPGPRDPATPTGRSRRWR